MIQVYYIISFSQNDMHILSYVTKKTVKDMNIVLIILNIMIDYYYTTVHIYIYIILWKLWINQIGIIMIDDTYSI
jgi:hypothetical protein